MELDTFILTVEDFIEGRIASSFLKEEMGYIKEDIREYKEKGNEMAVGLLIGGIEEIEKYFSLSGNIEYIKNGLEDIKKANAIIEEDEPGEEANEVAEGKIKLPPTVYYKKPLEIPEYKEDDIEPKSKVPPAIYYEKPAEITEYKEEEIEPKSKIPPTVYYEKPSEISEYEEEEIEPKSKVPPTVYYEKTEEREQKIDYESDPIDSLLYGLLSAYQELIAKKIDKNAWEEKVEEIEEYLVYLFNNPEEYTEEVEEFRDIASDIIEAIGKLDTENNIDDIIENLRDLNLDLYCIQKDFEIPEGILAINQSIKEACDKFTDEAYKTGNYAIINEALQNYINNNMEKNQLIDLLSRMKQAISGAQEQYENLPVSEEELTMEVIRGDKLMNEGFMDWLYGIEIIEEGIDYNDRETLAEGMEYIFLGNKKLFLVQYFAEQIEKQLQIQKSFSESGIF